MHRTHISLTEEQVKALRRLAAERSVSMAELIRRAVDRLLEDRDDGEDARGWALAVVGAFASGRSDGAERHDHHLADACGE